MDVQQQSKQAGRRFLIAILTFATIIISVNILFAMRAFQTHTGEVTTNAYERGLHYNGLLEEARKNEALSWQTTLSVAKGSVSNEDVVSINITDAHKKPISLSSCKVTLRRPLNARQDMTPAFAVKGSGVCLAHVNFPALGQWEAHAEIQNTAGEVFHFVERFEIK